MTAPSLGLTARATVDRVIDGDTVCVSLHLPAVIRLRDCWAAELNTDAGQDARNALVDLLDPPSEIIVHVPTGEASSLTDIMTFGRVVGDIWRDADEHSVSHQLIALGYATSERS